MQTKTKYEEQVLKEMQNMPAAFQKKIVKLIHFFKKEINGETINNSDATKNMMKAHGKWQDDRSVEEQINDIYKYRKSRSGIDNIT